VHQDLRQQGLQGTDLVAATQAIGGGMEGLIEPALTYFHRKSWVKAMRADLVTHVLEELGLVADTAHGLSRAVVFVDLSSFTPLTSAMGDATAATVLERYAQLVRASARQWSGTVVKQIGDGFLLVFPDSSAAVHATVELERRLSGEPQFPAMHAGIHCGPVLYREGDYVGATMNVAARLLQLADRHEIVVTVDVRMEVGELADAVFEPLGTHDLKGVAERIELFKVQIDTPTSANRSVDPVCGMELADHEVAARMKVGDEEKVFCSQRCLAKFLSREEHDSLSP
jgi:adenylate cyclase